MGAAPAGGILTLAPDLGKCAMSFSSHAAVPAAKPRLRPLALAPARVIRETAADGSIRLRSPMPLGPYGANLAEVFRAAVAAQPDRIFLAERNPDGAWRTLTYAQTRGPVDALAQALIDRGLSAARPVMALSGNAVDHALLMLGCFTAGVPLAPISVAYSLQSQDHAKLKHIAELLRPGLVYVADTEPFAAALAALELRDADVVASRNGANRDGVRLFSNLLGTLPGPAVDRAVAGITPGTIAKFLFTSGSTGLPKGVINTHGMLTANQQMIAQVWPFLAEQPLALVDWLPWNHTFGGNHNFNMVLRQAGSLYIDAGKPVPALIGETVRNLAEVSPTIYLNVPAGFAALLPHLERDEALAQSFFARLRLILYAGAALPDDLWQRLETVAVRTTGERIPMTSSWGTTETAPLATAAHFPLERAGVVGIPAPGVELKLVPSGEKLEIRVRGPNITPGYWKRDDLTEAAFDEEGFYRPGDAVRFADSNDPAAGVVFDGRISEDFKLTTGTWVHVGALRVAALGAASPVLQDAVVTGENRPFVGLMVWLNVAGCQTITGIGAAPAELSRHATIREHLRQSLAAWNKGRSSSHRIERAIILDGMPSIDANEITDKGYVNQRLVLERRKAEVERLYAAEPDDAVIAIE
jgi:feruloyl-CoA synthase